MYYKQMMEFANVDTEATIFIYNAAAEHAQRQDDRAQLRYSSIHLLYSGTSIGSSPTRYDVEGYIDEPSQRLQGSPGRQFSLIHPRH